MSYREKVDKRLSRKQKAYEIGSLMKEKRSEDYQVFEEVFDKSTLKIIYDFMNQGVIDEIHGVVNAGKEARVYWGKETFLDILGYETLRNQLRHSFHKLWIPMDNPSNFDCRDRHRGNNET